MDNGEVIDITGTPEKTEQEIRREKHKAKIKAELADAFISPPEEFVKEYPITKKFLFSEDIAARVCLWIASGQSLRSFCAHNPGTPSYYTILRWLRENPEFKKDYDDARIMQCEVWADELMDIADDNSKDIKTVMRKGAPYETVDYDNINRSKLKVDTRKWVLSKMLPKKYGDASTVKLADNDGGPLTVVIRKFAQLEEPKKEE